MLLAFELVAVVVFTITGVTTALEKILMLSVAIIFLIRMLATVFRRNLPEFKAPEN